MNLVIRQLDGDAIRLVGQIDNSDRVDARYSVHRQHGGLGLCLQREVVAPAQEEPNWGEKELAHRYTLWARNRTEEGAVFFGAFAGERLVGMSSVVRSPGSRTAELYALHVDRAHRRQGIGSTLLAESEKQCLAWGCEMLILYTGFKATSVDFYRARGYQVIGIQSPGFRTKNFDLTLARRLTE